MIQYETIMKEKYAEVADFLVNNFFVTEPFGLALGLPLDQVTRWYPEFLSKMLEYSDPVSLVALDKDTGKIAGAIVSIVIDPQKPDPPSMLTFLDPEKEPVKIQIATFLERLEDGLDIHTVLKQPKASKILACLFLSVAEGFGGKGIAKELVSRSESNAKDFGGVTIAMTDTTSAFSYKVFLKLGYELIKEVEYLKYQDPKGDFIFQGKEEKLGVHTHARVVAKVLK